MAMKRSDIESLLKIHYFGPVTDLLNNSNVLLSRMEEHMEETGGKHIHMPARTGRTASIGARGDTTADADLPEGASPTYDNCTFQVRPQYATIRLTGLSMRTSRGPNYAFARAQTQNMEDTAKDFKKDINRQMFGDGSGMLARITDITTAKTTFTVSNYLYPTKPNKWMHKNMKVDVRVVDTHALTTGGDSATINSVSGTATVTFAANVTPTSTTGELGIYREDNLIDGSPDVINEFAGLWAAVDDQNPSDIEGATDAPLTGNYGSKDRDTDVEYQANVLDNGGTLRPLSVFLMQQGIDKGEEECGAETSVIIGGYPLYRIYGATMAATKQAPINEMTLDGGFKALSVSGVPFVKEVDCPQRALFFLDESTFYLGVTGPWAYLEDDGGGILTRISGKDLYEAVLNRDMVLMCDKPPANTKMEDLAEV